MGRYSEGLLLLAGSTIVGLFFATQAYWNPAVRGLITWRKALAINLVYYWWAGAAVPLVVALARRFRFDTGRVRRALLVHVAASAVVTAAIIVATETVLTLAGVRGYHSLASVIPMSFQANFHSLLPTYWVILAGFYALDYYGKYRDRELRASQLEARLAEARLQALRMQLQPHFLFNTLNSISSLMYSDVEAADSMMSRLADFLRLTLESDGRAEVPLHRELEFVRRYLEIERIRFEERLRVRIDVAEGTLDVLVPSLLLQPLVENAVRHGIDRLPRGGEIAVAAAGIDGEAGRLLRLVVTNEGPAESGAEGSQRLRVGLANSRERLQQLYGAAALLRLEPRAGGGATVTLELPWRTADAPADADRR